MRSTTADSASEGMAYTDPAETRPFYRMLGLQTETGQPPGQSRVHLHSRPEFENSRGDVHGGVIAALLDAAMGVAARSSYEQGAGATTVSITVNYLQPGRDHLVAIGRTVRNGKTFASLEATVSDAEGNTVAQALSTMRVIARKK
jgi:uncharacterized protein (TIGR00369 family)